MREKKSNFRHNNWNKAWGHFQTITRHKILVMKGCFRVGLYKQGLLHDLSKYSPEEFKTGMQYYQGSRSPNAAEKEIKGYSAAWLHHKGRNKHHFEYWIDVSGPDEGWKLVGVRMPVQYLAEMVMDRIAASKIYQGKAYTDASPYIYFCRNKDNLVMHPETKAMLDRILRMLRDKGERHTFAYVRHLLKIGY
ncbi:MAG: catalase [Lachnospiraceae bacterium]|nr:catalase [Lachnospiraceae bacterium]